MKTITHLSWLCLVTCLSILACQQVPREEKTSAPVVIPNDALELPDDIEIEPPRTAEPPSPSPSETKKEISSSHNKSGNWEEAPNEAPNNESYAPITENDFQRTAQHPLSTFSIDVDQASYSNCRRFLNDGQLPPTNAVRIEEFINYFGYDYPQPTGETPFSVSTEMSTCPWNSAHQLLHIGIQGKTTPKAHMPPSNLVFLLDVSGSMNNHNKLPLLKNAFKMLTQQLRQRDKVSIVVYAGASGLVLPPTLGENKQEILDALQRLETGGGTAGEAGIKLAYQVAQQHLIKDGNNRVILATDGDFNIGMSSEEEMVKLIEKKREKGIFLSVLGFGTGNYKDSMMEQLADHGNGNYAYIDNLKEARKVLVNEITGTLFTIAKDVKLQIEFNPAHVAAYRLVGYENRKLKDEDFNDDTKDAGELGAGHTVTALYELMPTTVQQSSVLKVDPLKYQKSNITEAAKSDPDWMTLKLRYKHPKGNTSQLLTFTAKDEGLAFKNTSHNFRFSAAVAGFGMLLRDSKYKGTATYDYLAKMARSARGKDPYGHRIELVDLIEMAEVLDD